MTGLVIRSIGGDPPPSISIDHDQIRIALPAPDELRFVVFAHEVEPSGGVGVALARGVLVECGPVQEPRPCTDGELALHRASAEALARERDRVVAEIWEYEGSRSAWPAASATDRASIAPDYHSDRVLLVLGLLTALAVLVVEIRRPSPSSLRITPLEAVSLVALVCLFVGCVVAFTSLWPLHEHNSFVARAGCAIDAHCLQDPAAAWSPTSMHAYGMLLHCLGRPLPWLGWLSVVGVGLSAGVIILVWALTRRLLIELARPGLARYAGLLAAGVLCVHPVYWRLAGAASMWPLAIMGCLVAALAGLWASGRREVWAATLGWFVASCSFAVALGGNIVLVTLLPLAAVAPLAWTRVPLTRRALVRAGAFALIPLLVLAVLVESDVSYALSRARTSVSVRDYPIATVTHGFAPLLLDGRVSTRVWAPLMLLALAWLLPKARRLAPDPFGSPSRPARVRALAPIVYAWAVPQTFLGVAAGNVIGSSYPVGFLNHHWELVGAAMFVGIGGAWVMGAAMERWSRLRQLRWAWLGTGLAIALALVLGPQANEGWRFATQQLVVERELAALQLAFPNLPGHDRLVIAPRVLPTTPGVQRIGDPIEVVFPVLAYERAMQARGMEPAEVCELSCVDHGRTDERVLVYVGTSLRSFLPEEMTAGVVPGTLERPELQRLRNRWTLEPALSFSIDTRQHEAASMRLGADRTPSIALGFYWVRPR